MKKFLSYIQSTLSLIAITLSIVAINVTYPRSADSGLDYIGIIVGSLGVLVAILIGWQLYESISTAMTTTRRTRCFERHWCISSWTITTPS